MLPCGPSPRLPLADEVYGDAINGALEKNFGDMPHVSTIAEPGRGLVGDAGVIRAEVVLISEKENNANERWVYLDIGKFSGLAETMDESIKCKPGQAAVFTQFKPPSPCCTSAANPPPPPSRPDGRMARDGGIGHRCHAVVVGCFAPRGLWYSLP